MASSALRRVGLSRCASGIFISRTCCIFCGKSSQNGAAGCWNFAARILQFGHRMISTNGSVESPPWLMLPPTFEGDRMFYNFYSLAQKKVLKHPKSNRGGGEESESPDDDAEFVGSSHGWLALLNRRNNDLFLSNPLTRRHIKLQPIELLRDPDINLRDNRVTKVILSSSPDVEGCLAMLTFGPTNRLAFSLPGHSWRWSPIGSLLLPRISLSLEFTYEFARVWEDFIYCNRRKVLTCMAPYEFDLLSFDFQVDIRQREGESPIENWDIGNSLIDDWHTGNHPFEFWDDGYPPMDVWNIRKSLYLKNACGNERGKYTISWVEENMAILEERCIQVPHLVYAQQSDQLYLAIRFVEVMAPDGRPLDRVPLCPVRGLRDYYPCKTFGFIVFKVDQDGCYEVLDDLNGLAIFVGINHSFAISVAGSSELKPNSVYFTNARRIRMLYGSDTGIFDYEHKTISPIIDPDDDASQRIERDESLATSQKIESSALWYSS